ncbi:hypothetical protein AMTRI_Chr08g210360 [Amborella trichopoda]
MGLVASLLSFQRERERERERGWIEREREKEEREKLLDDEEKGGKAGGQSQNFLSLSLFLSHYSKCFYLFHSDFLPLPTTPLPDLYMAEAL